jgi:hypothetical protein
VSLGLPLSDSLLQSVIPSAGEENNDQAALRLPKDQNLVHFFQNDAP